MTVSAPRLAAATTALLLGGAASAGELGYQPDLDESIAVDSFSLSPDSDSFSLDVPVADDGLTVVGFSFTGTVSGVSGTTTWGSDTAFTLTAPSGQAVTAGGFNFPNDLDWDFDGSGSTEDGPYASGPHLTDRLGDPLFGGGTPEGGTWNLTFLQTFFDGDQTVTWSDVTVTLHKIPAPGAIALLGLAGVAGRRRRRH